MAATIDGMALGVGQRLGRYEILKPISEGGTAGVYLAQDTHLGREVAVKVLHARPDEQVLQRFALEAKSIAVLRHPNIVSLLDFSPDEGGLTYLVMEYTPGRSLFHISHDRGPMTEGTALCVAHEVCLALEHAHGKGVVHRDIKPENILLDDGRLVLTDFGGVKVTESSVELGIDRAAPKTMVLGTPGFMAPEQYLGKKVGPHTDIFGLGVTLYNLVTHTLPYQGSSPGEQYESLRKGDFKDPSYYQPMLTAEFCELITSCMDYRIAKRFPSAAELRQRVMQLLERQGVTEIRRELVEYQEDPEGLKQRQIGRSVNYLLRELKVALKDHDLERATTLLTRLQLVAPGDTRAHDISGIIRDRDRRLILDTPRMRKPLKWGAAGVGIGFLLGVAGLWLALHYGLLDGLLGIGPG